MNNIEQEINRMKKEVEEAKRLEATADGRIQENMKRLKEEFGLTSIEDVKAEIEKEKGILNRNKIRLDRAMTSLRSDFKWN